MDNALKQIFASFVPVSQRVETKPQRAHGSLRQHDDPAQPQERAVCFHEQRYDQKPRSHRAADDGNPFGAVEKPVLSVVGEAEDEIAGEAAGRKKDDPMRPFNFFVGDQGRQARQILVWAAQGRSEKSSKRQLDLQFNSFCTRITPLVFDNQYTKAVSKGRKCEIAFVSC